MKWLLVIILGVVIMQCVEAQIINEKTEEFCLGQTCYRDIYSSNQFPKYNNQYYYFNQTLSTSENDLDIGFNYLDNTQITLTPVVYYKDTIIDLKNLPTANGIPLNYISTINRNRDNIKFEIEFDMIEDLRRIGFRINSNQDINYIDYGYIKSGVYNETPDKYSVTDLRIGDQALSFTDLIEEGYDISYDKHNDILWIDLENKVGRIIADPIAFRYSASTDGFFSVSEPNTCVGATSNGTTGSIGDDHTLVPATMFEGVFDFNTSLPSGNYIYFVQLRLYRHAFIGLGTSTWDVLYYTSNRSVGATLTCADRTTGNGQGFVDWQGTIGTYWHAFNNPSYINTTGDTKVLLNANWLHVDAGKQAIAQFRTSEYAGTGYDPLLRIVYTTDSSYPVISWTYPTPDDSSTQSDTSVYLNTSITDNSSVSAFFDWNNRLKAYWSMDEYNNSGIFDNSSYDNFCNFVGTGTGISYLRDGIYGKDLDFDGVNGHLNCSKDDSLNITNEITMETWLYYDSLANAEVNGLMGEYDANNQRNYGMYIYGLSGDDRLYALISEDGTIGAGSYSQSFYTGIKPLKWYHIAMTYNGSGDDTIYLYVNGSPAGSASLTGADNIHQGNVDFLIGSQGNSGTPYRFLDGRVGEVRVYNRILSGQEINASYNNSLHKLFHNFTNLDNATYDYCAYAIDEYGYLTKSCRSVSIGGIISILLKPKERNIFPLVLLITMMFIAMRGKNEKKLLQH